MNKTEPLQKAQAQETSNWSWSLSVLIIFLPFLILAGAHLISLIYTIFIHNDTSHPEAATIYALLTALRTGNLYSDPFHFPLNVQPFGPVFYLIGTVLAWVAHGDPMLTTELARSLSLLSFLGSVGLIALLSWRLERIKHQTAITIVLGLACAWAIPFCATSRPDALSIFFILAALAAYEVAQGRSRIVFWVGILATLSCLTKQTTAPVLLALAIDTLIARRLRNTAALIAGCLPVPALFVSALWLRHEPFFANLFALKHVVFNLAGGLLQAVYYVRMNQMSVIPISIAMLGAGLSWKKEKYRAILLAFAFGCIGSLAALANIGGWQNYLILPWLLMILLVPGGLVKVQEWSRRSFLIPLGLGLLGMLLLVHQRNFLLSPLPTDLDAFNLDVDNMDKLNMLTDLSYLELHSRQPQLLDPHTYHQFYLQNVWSDAPILRQIDGEEFDLILISGENGQTDSEFLATGFRGVSYWGADALGEIERHYRVLCEVPGYLAFVPQDRSVALQDKDVGRIFRQPCLASDRMLQLAPGTR